MEQIFFWTILIADPLTVVSWTTCIFILNNFIFPTSCNFFLRFQEYLLYQNLTFHFEIKLNEYLIFYKSSYDLCILIFQVAVLFMIFLDLLRTNVSMIKKLRKIFYFIFFSLSTFITPPEVLYQLIMSICIILIYEVLIIYMIFKMKLGILRKTSFFCQRANLPLRSVLPIIVPK